MRFKHSVGNFQSWIIFQEKSNGDFELNSAFGLRTSNVCMYFDKYDAGLNLIGIETSDMNLVGTLW